MSYSPCRVSRCGRISRTRNGGRSITRPGLWRGVSLRGDPLFGGPRKRRELTSSWRSSPTRPACPLLAGFGPDDCYGLAWTLLHLIETAPGAQTAEYPADSDNPWVQQLRRRVENARGHDQR